MQGFFIHGFIMQGFFMQGFFMQGFFMQGFFMQGFIMPEPCFMATSKDPSYGVSANADSYGAVKAKTNNNNAE